MNLKLRVDKRDLSYHTYGQVTEFPDNYDVDQTVDLVQPVGNVQCALYTVDNITESKTGKRIDINELWERVPHDKNGTDPRQVLSMISRRLQPPSPHRRQLLQPTTVLWQ